MLASWRTDARDDRIAEVERPERDNERLRRERDTIARDVDQLRREAASATSGPRIASFRTRSIKRVSRICSAAVARLSAIIGSGPLRRASAESSHRRCGCAIAGARARFRRAVVAIVRGHLEHRLNALIDRPGRRRVAQRVAGHLAIEYPAVFTFLLDPAIDATNWRAEQALGAAVVACKVCGGNRTDRGAQTQLVLASVLRTIQQRRRRVCCLCQPPLLANVCRRARAVTTGPVESHRSMKTQPAVAAPRLSRHG